MSVIKCLLLPEPWYWNESGGFIRLTNIPPDARYVGHFAAVDSDDYRLLVYTHTLRKGFFTEEDNKRVFPNKQEAMLWVETMIATGAAGDGNPLE